MQPKPSTTDTDNFRVVDLFSPADSLPRPAAAAGQSAGAAPGDKPAPAGGMPDSFVFANPLFASTAAPRPAPKG